MSRRVPFRPVDGEPYVAWWQERFDAPEGTFEGLSFFQRGRSTVWAATASVEGLEAARTDAVGLPFLRVGSRLWKPPSAAVVAFGSVARRNAIDLDADEAAGFLAGAPRPLADDDPRRQRLAPGFIVVRTAGVALGCGEWHGEALLSRIPKGRRIPEVLL